MNKESLLRMLSLQRVSHLPQAIPLLWRWSNRSSSNPLHGRYVSSSVHIEPHHSKQDKLAQKIKVCYLDLRGFGISILERLVIEECILKHDPERRHWIICGTHTATPHKYLHVPTSPSVEANRTILRTDTNGSDELDNSYPNDAVAIVMGIGGKPKELLHIPNVQRDSVMVMKRFTGGGTVVLDHNSIWTTIIGRPTNYSPIVATRETGHDDTILYHPQQPLHHPKPIMEYTANTIYQPIFEQLNILQEQKLLNSNTVTNQSNRKTLVLDSKSCSFDNSGRLLTIPESRSNSLPPSPTLYKFALRENDYVLHHNTTEQIFKMGGNAQAITKDGFLHHTSFLWDYEKYNMEEYLMLPKKRPQYRNDRNHTSFLVSLQAIYPSLQKQHFFSAMYDTCHNIFDVQRMSFVEVMNTIVNAQGGIQSWYESNSRTKIVHDL